MFSCAVKVGSRLKKWKTKPIRSRRTRALLLVERGYLLVAEKDLP
jgi:hypothetical protein